MKKEERKEIEVVCEKCGRKFTYPYIGWGKKPRYCIDCVPNPKNRDPKLERFIDEEQITVNANPIKVQGIRNNSQYNEFWKKVIEILGRLDSCRVDLCNITSELKQYQSGFDKVDQVYLHNLENLDVSSTSDVKKFLNDWKLSRTGRRDVKDIICFVSNIIEGIPLKNVATAYDYMQQVTLGEVKRKYNPEKVKITHRY